MTIMIFVMIGALIVTQIGHGQHEVMIERRLMILALFLYYFFDHTREATLFPLGGWRVTFFLLTLSAGGGGGRGGAAARLGLRW